jgi:hypothetical protein
MLTTPTNNKNFKIKTIPFTKQNTPKVFFWGVFIINIFKLLRKQQFTIFC